VHFPSVFVLCYEFADSTTLPVPGSTTFSLTDQVRLKPSPPYQRAKIALSLHWS
jgi:hypothetical protein